jgi:hypothetical protein
LKIPKGNQNPYIEEEDTTQWPKEIVQTGKGVVSKIDSKNVFNIDPIRILYFMKEHMRTIDMFLKFDKDNSNSLSRDELHFAFEVC